MARAAVAGAVVVAAVAGYLARERGGRPAEGSPAAQVVSPTPTGEIPAPRAADDSQGFLYGRITTVDGATFEGRLRWGGGEEAFWDDSFNGIKLDNPWLAQVPASERPLESDPIELFGVVLARRERPSEVTRPFVSPFGAIERIAARGDEVRVTLKGGGVFDLDRFEASDFDDGLRVWDGGGPAIDLDSLRIRQIDFLATPALGGLACRLSGVVRTKRGDFRGFVAWNRDVALGSDELSGRSGSERLRLRFAEIRALARGERGDLIVTLRDGRALALSESSEGDGRRGLYVHDVRYGRVLVSWEAFERVDFDAPADPAECASGPAYDEFGSQRPLRGTVTTRDGARISGRLIYDLDESSGTDTLDAAAAGVEYALPFERLAAIVLPAATEGGEGGEGGEEPSARVILRDGTEVALSATGDLAAANAGLLVYVDGRESPAYVPWANVARLDFEPLAVGPGSEVP